MKFGPGGTGFFRGEDVVVAFGQTVADCVLCCGEGFDGDAERLELGVLGCLSHDADYTGASGCRQARES